LSGGAAAEKPRVRATSSTSEGDPCGALNAELDSAPRSAPAPPRMRRSADDIATEGTRFALERHKIFRLPAKHAALPIA
jgi:hypothetical protein